MFRIEVQNLQQEYQCPADKDLLRGMEGAGKKRDRGGLPGRRLRDLQNRDPAR